MRPPDGTSRFPHNDRVDTDEFRATLEASRQALLAALEGLGDRDFTTTLPDGTTIIGLLAALAAQEREAVRLAREAVGAEARPLPTTGGPRLSRAIPPQVVHDLAGARHETMLLIDAQRAALVRDASSGEAAQALLVAVVEREWDAARQIAAHRKLASQPG